MSLYDVAAEALAWVFHAILPLLGPIWGQY